MVLRDITSKTNILFNTGLPPVYCPTLRKKSFTIEDTSSHATEIEIAEENIDDEYIVMNNQPDNISDVSWYAVRFTGTELHPLAPDARGWSSLMSWSGPVM